MGTLRLSCFSLVRNVPIELSAYIHLYLLGDVAEKKVGDA
jgi:hypothetical protein